MKNWEIHTFLMSYEKAIQLVSITPVNWSISLVKAKYVLHNLILKLRTPNVNCTLFKISFCIRMLPIKKMLVKLNIIHNRELNSNIIHSLINLVIYHHLFLFISKNHNPVYWSILNVKHGHVILNIIVWIVKEVFTLNY